MLNIFNKNLLIFNFALQNIKNYFILNQHLMLDEDLIYD